MFYNTQLILSADATCQSVTNNDGGSLTSVGYSFYVKDHHLKSICWWSPWNVVESPLRSIKWTFDFRLYCESLSVPKHDESEQKYLSCISKIMCTNLWGFSKTIKNHSHFHHIARSSSIFEDARDTRERCLPVLSAPAAQPVNHSGQPPRWGQSVCGWWHPGDPGPPEAGWGPAKERTTTMGQGLCCKQDHPTPSCSLTAFKKGYTSAVTHEKVFQLRCWFTTEWSLAAKDRLVWFTVWKNCSESSSWYKSANSVSGVSGRGEGEQ